ncbi:kinase-like domain-containing protein [Rhizophagus clarus]|uniref:Kinase-like domain-containing protein n=1 Tax=Rhizophagus clarus TaxID=94130 RepID=A0A8H3M596_9GLOM|nr:kinase-like domain-containing protein [Rhizophagus clarus]
MYRIIHNAVYNFIDFFIKEFTKEFIGALLSIKFPIYLLRLIFWVTIYMSLIFIIFLMKLHRRFLTRIISYINNYYKVTQPPLLKCCELTNKGVSNNIIVAEVDLTSFKTHTEVSKVIHVLRNNWTWVALMFVPIVRFVIFVESDDVKKIEKVDDDMKNENLKNDMNSDKEKDNFNWKIMLFSSELLGKILPRYLLFYKNQFLEREDKNDLFTTKKNINQETEQQQQQQFHYYNQYNQKIISLDYWNLLFLIEFLYGTPRRYFFNMSKCFDCKRMKTDYRWCKNCNSKRFQQNFNKWTSGNKFIDKFIKEAQLKAENEFEVIEWIPYNRLSNIKYLAKGGFSIIYEAIWSDGRIEHWDKKGQKWSRYLPLNKNEVQGLRVVLKCLNNSSNINDDFLKELKNHLQCVNSSCYVVRIFGITQDPETSNYMIVMNLIKEGNLRSNLLIKKYNPFEKYENLMNIARAILALHECNLVHGDFHSGNVLLNYNFSYISDFGLSRPVNQIINSKEIYGVIPYMSPEVLRGKPYTKAADIYSFGIIMWEFTSGVPVFNDKSHDFNLSLDICKGLRPKIEESTSPVYARLMRRCWDSDPNKRPSAGELVEILTFWCDYYPTTNFYDRIPVPKFIYQKYLGSEPIAEGHPLSCYISRKIDYSAKLDIILSKEELSTKFIIEEKEFNNETTLSSESLENCMISD